MSVQHPIPPPLIGHVARRFMVFGQPVRLRIIEQLELNGEMSVQALADALDATQQNISRHLGLLYAGKIVDRRQDGRQVWYRVADRSALALLDTVGAQVVEELRGLERPEDGSSVRSY